VVRGGQEVFLLKWNHTHICLNLHVPLAVQLDEFVLDLGTQDIGQLEAIDVGLSTQQSLVGGLGSLLGQQWCCSSVEVAHLMSGSRVFFACDQWVQGRTRRLRLVPGQQQAKNTYKVTSCSGNVVSAELKVHIRCTRILCSASNDRLPKNGDPPATH
jgi:hypothetical protein